MVLNPGTGHVSPQYHLVFDDNFTIVNHMRDGTVPPNWRELVTTSSFSSTDEQFSLADVWLQENAISPSGPDSAPLLPSATARPSVSEGGIVNGSSISEGVSFVPDLSMVSERAQNVDFSPDIKIPASPLASEGASSTTLPSPACEGEVFHMPPMVNLETAGLRRSSRTCSRSLKAQQADQTKEVTSYAQFGFFCHLGGDRLVSALMVNHDGYKSLTVSPDLSFFSCSVERFHHLNAHFDGTFNVLSQFAFAALNDLNDTYTLREMLKQKDVANFVEAMLKEVNDHET